MNPFDHLISDIFANGDITESCTIEGLTVRCCASSLQESPELGEWGLDDGENFYLDLPPGTQVRKGMMLGFRQRHYRIASLQLDSVNLSIRVFLSNIGRIGK